MATTKKSTTKKSTVKNVTKKVANTNNAEGTRLVCPVCGSEFQIGEHEHTVKNATVIGVDSNLGTVFMPVNKRGDALKAAGIDTSKYFSINLPTGGEQWMRMDDDGKAIPVDNGDPVLKVIIEGGTIPNRSLFRRWVMSQVFRGLVFPGGFSQWLDFHGYNYQWKMIVKEFDVQTSLYKNDMENFKSRNRWFNKNVLIAMAESFIKQVRDNTSNMKRRNCKGVPYITFGGVDVFVSNIDKKIILPLHCGLNEIHLAKTPQEIYKAALKFYRLTQNRSGEYTMNREWKDSYRGMGAYATMQNLLRFHGCTFPKNNDFYKRGLSGLVMLEHAAEAYADGDGWRLFGLMKQMIDENGIDIRVKQLEWAQKKAVASRSKR